MQLELWKYLLIGLATFVASAINALAGGGTLLTFPALTAMGVPAVVANVTNHVALFPGYLGAVGAQWKIIKSQIRRLYWYIPAALLGGVVGGFLLLRSNETLFKDLVPFLILSAALLLAFGDQIRNWIAKRNREGASSNAPMVISTIAVFVAGIYGGYFGAGLSVIYLAVLGIFLNDSLTELNGLKQILSLTTNMAASLFFVFSDKVNWTIAAIMAVFALLGGVAGGKLAGRVSAKTLRIVVVTIGIIVAIIYFIKQYA
jgi:hypothetical protein